MAIPSGHCADRPAAADGGLTDRQLRCPDATRAGAVPGGQAVKK